MPDATPAPTINVQGPDGSSFSFPEGTPHDTISSALQAHYGQNGGGGPKLRGVAANVGAGINDWAADTLGALPDAAAYMLRPQHWMSLSQDQKADYVDKHPIAGKIMQEWERETTGRHVSNSIKSAMGLVGADPRNVEAVTPGEKIARAAGGGIASMVIPGLGAEAVLAKEMTEANSFGRAMTEIIKGSGPVSNAIIGTGSGAGGEIAKEAAPERYKGLAETAGGIAGGVGAGGLVAGAEAAGSAVKHAWQSLFEPAEVRAARLILAKASDPEAFRASLQESAEGGPLVAGSEPTTFQATGDLGVGAYERGVANQNPAAFAARRQEQNAARLRTLQGLADAGADPQSVTDYVKGRLQDLTVDHAQRVAQAANDVADSLHEAGGETFDNAAAYGEALRGPLDDLHKRAKAEASKMWRAIDPDLNLPVQTADLKDATKGLLASIPDAARPPEGEEAAILGTIQSLGPSTSFGNMTALRSRLTDAIMAERRSATGSPTVLRRLAITLDNVDNTLAEKAGEVASDPTKAGSLFDRLRAEAKAFKERQANAAARGDAAGPGLGGGGQADELDAAGAVPPAPGAEGEGGGQPGVPARDQGVSEDRPGEGEEVETQGTVQERYAAARKATAQEKQTFTRGPVGSVLQPGPTAGSFRMLPSNVPKNLFDKPEALKAFVAAAKDNPEALSTMQDYAAFSLRQAAVKDGMLSPAKYNQWVADHQYALRQFPDLAGKFSTLRDAQASLDTALANQKAALTDFQDGAARHFLGDQDPVRAVGNAIKNPGDFAKLAALTRGDPAAQAGLRRATIEWMMQKSLSAAEAGTSGVQQINGATFQKLIASNRLALSSIFGADERASMDAVASDIQRANRSIVAVKNPGGSNTPQDLAEMEKNSSTMLERIVRGLPWVGGAAELLGGGGLTGGIVGAAAGKATKEVLERRAAAINKAVVEMMLDPRKAAAGLAKVTPESTETAGAIFARRMRALTASEVERAARQTGQQK